MFIGYHASHEQFSPRELLSLVPRIEQAGFAGIMSSEHFAPWSVRQGQSGFGYSWLGAAMARSELPFGSLAVPGGTRFHPAIVAQAVSTLAGMFPGRLPWIAVGSGEYLNEHITGEPWPEKSVRNQRLFEAVEIMRALFRGETVTRLDGLIKTDRARIWSLPPDPPKLYAAALTPGTAKWAGGWADGMITVCMPPAEQQKIIEAFRQGGGAGKPIVLQMQISWAGSREQALDMAWDQWRNAAIPKAKTQDLATPEMFDSVCSSVTREDMDECVLISDRAEQFIEWIDEYRKLGFDEIYLHNAGRNQDEFIEYFGHHVLPAFR